MTSKRDVRFSSDSKTWSHWGFVCGLALLMGCAAPATREQAPAPDHSTRSAQPAAAPAPAEAQPAGTAHAAEPAPPAAAPHQQSAEDLAAKDGPMSDADREALAELIRAQVMAAQAERASHEPEPASPKPQTEGATPKEALAAPALRNEQPSAAAQLSRGDHVPSTAPSTAPGAPAATSGARMKLSPSEFDFKEVWQSQPAEGEFSIENVGTEPLTLDTRSSCGCTVATKLKSPLDPGETTKFKISYNTSRPG